MVTPECGYSEPRDTFCMVPPLSLHGAMMKIKDNKTWSTREGNALKTTNKGLADHLHRSTSRSSLEHIAGFKSEIREPGLTVGGSTKDDIRKKNEA